MENHKKVKEGPTYGIWSMYRAQIMGLSIISIILYHFVKDLQDGNIVLPVLIQNVMKYIGSAGVDVFLFLSGLGLYYSLKRSGDHFNIRKFYIDKISRVLVPYILIAVPSLIIRNVIVRSEEWIDVIKDLTFVTFFTEGEVWYWYILMICICYIIFPFLYQAVETARDGVEENMRFLTVLSFTTLICLFLSLYEKDLFSNINGALLRFFPFILGAFAGKKSYEKRAITWVNYAELVLVLLIFPMAANSNAIIKRYISAVNVLAFCFVVCLVFYYTRNLKVKPLKSCLGFVGKYTLELYLTHVMMRTVLALWGYRARSLKVEAVLVASSIILSAILHVVSGWILKLFKIKK